MRLQTKRLVLRDYRRTDAKSLVANINNLEISKWLLVVPYPYRMKDAIDFLKKNAEKQKKKPREGYNFAIELKSKKGVIGAVGLHKVNRFNGTAEMGYWLGQDYWRQGYMYEATSRVLDFAFRTLKLRRMDISAFAGNKASNGLIRKLGFKYEGVRRNRMKAKATGKVHDEKIYGLLREDWVKRRS